MLRKIKKRILAHYTHLVENRFPIYFRRKPYLASLYYFLFSDAFHREHQSVLGGKVKHLESKKNFYLLVRNTHRIEKGLLMKPRKNIFAKSYIGETIEAFTKFYELNSDEKRKLEQSSWIHDVLKEYFEVVELDEELKLIKKKFLLVSSTFNRENKNIIRKIPYNRAELSSQVTFEDFYNLSKQRRSVRWYKDKPVERELIDKAIRAANQAPSACNRQPYEFIIIDDKELLENAVQLPMGTSGYSHSIPVMVFIVGNLDAYFSERDRHLIYIDASLASMSLMYALETLKLSSCPINWPDIEKREVKAEKFLKLKSHQRIIMCLSIGYPDYEGKVAFSEKRDLNNIRKYNI